MEGVSAKNIVDIQVGVEDLSQIGSFQIFLGKLLVYTKDPVADLLYLHAEAWPNHQVGKKHCKLSRQKILFPFDFTKNFTPLLVTS